MDKLRLLSDQDEAVTEVPSQPPTAPNAGQYQKSRDEASAPPAEFMPAIAGYEAFGSRYRDVPPPPLGYQQQNAVSSPAHNLNTPAISEALARQVFAEFVSVDCCYKTNPAEEVVFTDMHAVNTYRYRLETFTESRTTKWMSVPYNGQAVDGSSGVEPDLWDIVVPIPTLFRDSERDIHIPHTSSLKACESCLRLGKSACDRCVNSGRIQCQKCGGSGRTASAEQSGGSGGTASAEQSGGSGRTASDEQCSKCTGHGRIKCTVCGGTGSITCKKCKGHGQIFTYKQLKIKWVNNQYSSLVDMQAGLPIDFLHSATGEILFSDMNVQVQPVVSFPEGAINSTSQSAVQEHQVRFSTTCRILQQKQTIELIPVTRVHCTWNEKTYIYFVYGTENQVFAKDYPVKWFCCRLS